VDEIADDPAIEVFYRRLHSVADDFGRFSADPRIIRAACYPLRLDSITESDIRGHLNRCERAGLMVAYVVNGKHFLELCDFNQRLRLMKSRYPARREVDELSAHDGQMAGICRRETNPKRIRNESETNRKIENEEKEAEADFPPLPDDSFRLDDGFEELWTAYPAKGRIKRPLAERAYVDVMAPSIDRRALHAAIVASVCGPWSASETWSRGIVAGLDRFLREQRWLESPETSRTSKSGIADAVREALRDKHDF
jgi:hypothetical protein